MAERSLRERREAVVREHMESENRHEFGVTMATFGHPRYEIVPTGDVYDGEAEVARYFEESRRAFPDQRNELIKMYHADDSVIVESTCSALIWVSSAASVRPVSRSPAARSRSSSSRGTGSSASASTSTRRRSWRSSGSCRA